MHYSFALADEPVGVDLETVRPSLDVASVAQVACGDEERAQLAELPADEARATFFRWWTAKEAVTKATGHGLQADFRTVRERSPGVWAHDGALWAVTPLDVPVTGVLGAVALPHRP